MSEKKPINMIVILFLCLMTVFQKKLLGTFRLIGVIWPPNSCSFQIIVFALLWPETAVLLLAWKNLLTTVFMQTLNSLAWESFREIRQLIKCKSRKVCQIKTFKARITVYFFPTKIWGIRYNEVNLPWTFHTVLKNCIRYNNCPLYRGFPVRVWPWFGRFHKKVSTITRCPLHTGLTV